MSRMFGRGRIEEAQLARQGIRGDGRHDEAAAERQREDADDVQELSGLVATIFGT